MSGASCHPAAPRPAAGHSARRSEPRLGDTYEAGPVTLQMDVFLFLFFIALDARTHENKRGKYILEYIYTHILEAMLSRWPAIFG